MSPLFAAHWRMAASAVSPFPKRLKTPFSPPPILRVSSRSAPRPALRGFKVSDQPSLATDKVRYVGELVAMCVAPSRAEAEDIAAAVALDFEELAGRYDMLAARESGSALLHEHWGDNVFLETFVDVNIEKVLERPIKVTREIRTARQCMAPIEGRGAVAIWDSRLEQLTLYSRARCRTSCAPDSPAASDWTRVTCAWWRPMSAAGSATRESCWPKKSASAGSPCIAASGAMD